MRLYVFGAGASAGSQHHAESPAYDRMRSNAAPLVDELFDQKYDAHAHFIDLSSTELADIRTQLGTVPSIEDWLTTEWKKLESLHPQMAAATRGMFGKITFYIWFLLVSVSKTYHPRNWYAVLLQKLRRQGQPFGLISFNYDLLLDRAVESIMNAPLSTTEGYTKANLIKPHGSVNWLLGKRPSDGEIPGISDARATLRLAAVRMFDTPFQTSGIQVFPPSTRQFTDENVGPADMLRYFREGVFYPLIVMPLTTKMYNVSGFEDTMTEQAVNLAREAQEVYLVGYKARDDIIGPILKTCPRECELHIVGRGDASEIMSRVRSQYQHLKRGTIYGDGFEAFVEQM